ncbi:MAG: NADH:flavin oxidoreductase/NADH oxidase family protein [Verrucomicrobia bacterium]|nr:NADH:flavin oxidoreductase/NADH oxidase family protein [Verrucomicrobiota bacterium]
MKTSFADAPSGASSHAATSPGLFSPLVLPNGTVIPNRIAKAAMAESLAGPGQAPDARLARMEANFAQGGVGLIITGNVMIDPLALGSPGDVVLQRGMDLAPFRAWAKAARSHGAQVWMQINHPGRQTMAVLGQPGWAPSEVAVDLGKHSKLIAKPKALNETQIRQIIQRFADTAREAEAAGFTGVEIHAAHGYLISQFLSPLTNLRKDKWGGSMANRVRFLLEVVSAVRGAVRREFCVGVKINSADFQRGGFDSDDALEVVKMLNSSGVDLVELSGGSYEAPAMQGQTRDGRTLAREAYFLEFARDISKVARMPIMTTGGIRRREVAEGVLSQGVSLVGIATSLAMDPGLPLTWREAKPRDGVLPTIKFKDKMLASVAYMAVIQRQLQRLGDGQRPLANASAIFSIIRDQLRNKLLARRYRSWSRLQS